MAVFGPDFRAGLVRPLYNPANPAGLGWAIAIFIALVLANQFLQLIFGLGLHAFSSAQLTEQPSTIRLFIIGLLPAGLCTAIIAWLLAFVGGGRPKTALALRFPALGVGGWVAIPLAFLFALYVVVGLAVYFLSIDTAPKGLVENAMAGLVNDRAYAVIVAGIAIGAPLAEELTFRGQIFAALSQTRLGLLGASVLTSFVWAAVHITEPLYAVALIFVMGLALSTLLIRFGSLWVTFVCHAIWNGIYSLALLALPHT
jgi:membrane protease YdiL (CAAX protease family)